MWVSIILFFILALLSVWLVVADQYKKEKFKIVLASSFGVVFFLTLILFSIQGEIKDVKQDIKQDEKLIVKHLNAPKEQILIKEIGLKDTRYSVDYDGNNFIVIIEDNKISKFVKK